MHSLLKKIGSKTKKNIYLDHASGTPLDPRVKKVFVEALACYGNPSSLHSLGVLAKQKLEESRKTVAKVLDVMPSEIYFVSGGTESDNIAILGVLAKWEKDHREIPHMIVSEIEHPAVLTSVEALLAAGRITLSYLPVNQEGLVEPHDLRKLITPQTILISVMYANNEIGSVMPIREIAKEVRHYKRHSEISSPYPLLHTDASQVPGYLSLRVPELGVDLLTLHSAKMYGPKGVGILYIKRSTPLLPLYYGGNQEKSIRPGTENVPAILAMASALSLCEDLREKEIKRLSALRDFCMTELKKEFPTIRINGSQTERLPNNINFTLTGISSETLVLYLDSYGICVSSWSACKSDEEETSHVIRALYKDEVRNTVEGSLRITMGRNTTKKDILSVIKALKEIRTTLSF